MCVCQAHIQLIVRVVLHVNVKLEIAYVKRLSAIKRLVVHFGRGGGVHLK